MYELPKFFEISRFEINVDSYNPEEYSVIETDIVYIEVYDCIDDFFSFFSHDQDWMVYDYYLHLISKYIDLPEIFLENCKWYISIDFLTDFVQFMNDRFFYYFLIERECNICRDSNIIQQVNVDRQFVDETIFSVISKKIVKIEIYKCTIENLFSLGIDKDFIILSEFFSFLEYEQIKFPGIELFSDKWFIQIYFLKLFIIFLTEQNYEFFIIVETCSCLNNSFSNDIKEFSELYLND